MRTMGFFMAMLFAGCGLANPWTEQTGRLVVAMTDTDGRPITNATVTVQTLKSLGINAGGSDQDYAFTSAETDSNGVATVVFRFIVPDFRWEVETPSHYSWHFLSPNECFTHNVEASDYMHIDETSAAGQAMVAELRALAAADDVAGYLGKFEPKRVTYGSNTIHRSVCFHPMRNPQPMYAYDDSGIYFFLPRFATVTNALGEVGKRLEADFDMKKRAFLTPSKRRPYAEIGEVSDFKLVCSVVETNGMEVFKGWVEFAPGCGAYRRRQSGDASFPMLYEADTNAVFETRLDFECPSEQGKGLPKRNLLEMDEYMVLRTRAVMDESGAVTNCHYSKILGPMRVTYNRRMDFETMIFNPRPNDVNLEFDVDRNLARRHQNNCYP